MNVERRIKYTVEEEISISIFDCFLTLYDRSITYAYCKKRPVFQRIFYVNKAYLFDLTRKSISKSIIYIDKKYIYSMKSSVLFLVLVYSPHDK